ncbi:RHS repeat-associated core domain-containing protein [Chryseobacterium sp. RRHN12]|uniref:RHS repeat-associated core domain-containing protein n=1 Tax=Chryseobacterium sp. RRHN12 TaxID=3437884 RepID=UPI003D9BC219
MQSNGNLDYGWRQYMPDLGRWNGMDQLAEAYTSTSPYAYVANNPTMYIDPDGRYTSQIQGLKDSMPNIYSGWEYVDGVKLGDWNRYPQQFNSMIRSLSVNDTRGGNGSISGSGNSIKWSLGGYYYLNHWSGGSEGPGYTDLGTGYWKFVSENFPSNKEITPWELGVEWISGKGPRHRDFTNGDLMTEMLKKHSHVQNTRDVILAKIADGETTLEGSNPYKLGGIMGVGLYLKDYSTLLTGGLTGNLTVTYLGSYNLKYIAAAYNNTVVVSFNVENSSTMQSASRPPILGYLPIWQQTAGNLINEKFKTGWGSKTTQSFNWQEILYIK